MKANLIRRSGILIPRKYQNTLEYVHIKESLQRRSKSYNTSDFTTNIFYIESEKFLLVPRYFPVKQYFDSYSMKNMMHEGKEIQINHSIKPRSESQEKAMDFMMNHERGILKLAPGVGKTVISIYMVAERKRKTIVLVHRDPLAKQWTNRFLEFTDLKEDDIARLTSATFKKDLEKPIIIATVQTFRSLINRNPEEFLTHLNNAGIGVLLADEVHTSIGAPKLSECSIHIPSRYTYGLSATPDRYDGNGDVITFHLGDIFSDDDLEGTMPSKVTVILLDYQIDTPRRSKYIRWGGDFQRARYLNLMKKSTPFREAMRGLLRRLKDNRDLICMVERIKLIEELYAETKSESKSMFCGKGGLETLESKLTLATPGKCRDGIDAPWKDALIMTSPISNIEQLAGRINRIHPEKKTPIIIDMVDFGSRDMAGTFWGRKKFYEKKQWPVQYFLFANNELKPLDDDEAIKIIGGE